MEVCKSAQKEKVFRVALSCLRNLLNHPDLALAGDMVDGGLTKCLATRALATWGDSDIPALIADMQEHLKTGIQARGGCAVRDGNALRRAALSARNAWLEQWQPSCIGRHDDAHPLSGHHS